MADNTDNNNKYHNPVVTTTSGRVRGRRVSDRVMRFTHIPYARAPLGEFRFLAPGSAVKWEGVRDGTEHGPSCIQPYDEVEANSLLEQSEDCLWLSIWTQGLDDRKRPVMVFIHGGGFIGGGAGADFYDGTQFSERGDVVLVSIQYRVGITGWLDLEELGGEAYRNSKNNGLLDQLEALRWINANISNFGGDPDNITIFGESAGSSSVLTLMVMPAAKGLFQKVIGQSCTFDYHRTAERCRNTTRKFLQITNISRIDKVLELKSSQIVDVLTRMSEESPYPSDWLFGPIFDGDILPNDPYAYIREGNTADIPVMHGTTADEYQLWLLYSGDQIRKDPRKELGRFVQEIVRITDDQLDRLVEIQKSLYPQRSEIEQYLDITSWMFFRYPHSRLSAVQSPQAPVWQYLFTWKSPNHTDLGAYHGIEMDFVFHHPAGRQIRDTSIFKGIDPPIQLIDQVQDAWLAFARNGDPNHKGLPHWPRYQDTDRPTMIFGENCGAKDNINPEMLEGFEAFGTNYGF